MSNIISLNEKEVMRACRNYMHILIGVYLLVTTSVYGSEDAMVGRKPANFVPDDDMIVVPMVIEKNIMQRFNEKHQERFYGARKQLELWLSQEQYAQDYGLEDAGFLRIPSPQEKQRFFERNYLRFISKDVERSTNRSIQDSWERWTADEEIDAIEAVEQHEKVLIYAKKKRGKEDKKIEKSVSVGKDRLRFGFQPRLEIGMFKFTLQSNHFYARAWVGVNGNQEVNIERRIQLTNTKIMGNYYIDEEKLLVAIDQPLVKNWSLRFTHTKYYNIDATIARLEESALEDDSQTLLGDVITEDNIAQIRFNMGF